MSARRPRGRIEETRARLLQMDLPERLVTEQTAICLLALLDVTPRAGLLPGKSSLREGARIHDIIEFARADLHRQVAENTRESYRKLSLNPLCELGLVTRHQLSTNDPNTYYRISEDMRVALLAAPRELGRRIQEIMATLGLGKRGHRDQPRTVEVRVGQRLIRLSPGAHNTLQKQVVERLIPILLRTPVIAYIGDTAKKSGYQDRERLRSINLPISVASALPDIVAVDETERRLVVVEVVTSSGPITKPARGIWICSYRKPSSSATGLSTSLRFLIAGPSGGSPQSWRGARACGSPMSPSTSSGSTGRFDEVIRSDQLQRSRAPLFHAPGPERCRHPGESGGKGRALTAEP